MSAALIAVTMPKWGIEMQEGTLTWWHVELGANVDQGQELADIETEKIVNALDSPGEGVLRRRLAELGDTLPVGALLAVIAAPEVPEEDVDAFVRDFRPADASFEQGEPATGAPAARPGQAPDRAAADSGTRAQPRISPVVRRLAERLGVDLTEVRGSGRDGRISKQDVEAAASGTRAGGAPEAPEGEYAIEVISGLRRTLARRLAQAQRDIPHFYLSVEIAADALLERREALNRERDAAVRLSLNDLLVRAVALALQREPHANVQVHGEEIHRYRHAHIAVAVDTPDGLLAPVLRAAETRSLDALAAGLRDLTTRARERSLAAQDLEGGTFTVSNLGMRGIRQFGAVINPPQGAILAVGAVEPRCCVRDGAAAVAHCMTVTLSCDHRAIDGAVGASFLGALRTLIEQPDPL